MERLRLPVRTKAVDALELDEEPFDAVLLDAPCSATGTIRRHPDVQWLKRPEDVATLASLQARMLDRAAALVAPGGILVFCTCSLEPEEGEAVAQAFLRERPDYALSPIRPEELPDGMVPSAEGCLRILPGIFAEQGGADSFFIARFSRN